MNKPTDYPLETSNTDSDTDLPASEITYAVLRERIKEEKPVTDEMIRIARTKLETAHGKSDTETVTEPRSTLDDIRSRFKSN